VGNWRSSRKCGDWCKEKSNNQSESESVESESKAKGWTLERANSGIEGSIQAAVHIRIVVSILKEHENTYRNGEMRENESERRKRERETVYLFAFFERFIDGRKQTHWNDRGVSVNNKYEQRTVRAIKRRSMRDVKREVNVGRTEQREPIIGK